MKINNIGCEVCKSTDLVAALDLGLHPLCDDLLAIGATDKCEEFRIEIALCSRCLTAHHLHQVPKRKLFPASYHYRSGMTQDVLIGMKSLVARTKEKYGLLKGKKVVDIGCNDGSLLRFFKDEGAFVFGVEPTDAADDAVKAGIRVVKDFFDSNLATAIVDEIGHPDFITFTNVFAHIEDIDSLLKALQILMGENTTLVIENHYLGSILDRFQFDTFYHEHPRTYSVNSFVEISKRLGKYIEIVEFPSRYGGNIRVFIGNNSPNIEDAANLISALQLENNFQSKFENMRSAIQRWKSERDSLLAKVRSSDGKIYAKAYPGRAGILMKILDLTEKEVTAVFEKPNSMKIGNYVPGTRIPILSENEMNSLAPAPRVILNLAWHISSEIQTYMKTLDPRYECVDIFSPEKYIQ